MQVLTEDAVRKRLDPDQVIAAIESAFRDRYPSTVIPARASLQMSGGIFLTMPCYDGARPALGMKLVVVQENPQRSEDRIQATYLLLDPQTGSRNQPFQAELLMMPINFRMPKQFVRQSIKIRRVEINLRKASGRNELTWHAAVLEQQL